eukprot:TRINITY_DN47227_c0_g1_i1.p1 TRINITY_DN47227_c0_g1~~TRINITY_DN47227_c0_g1_i1.p1  ORF type:complete len:619 (+),score=106.00 TRINITY_DN47227_c0_g1_i1:73-1929(+)
MRCWVRLAAVVACELAAAGLWMATTAQSPSSSAAEQQPAAAAAPPQEQRWSSAPPPPEPAPPTQPPAAAPPNASADADGPVRCASPGWTLRAANATARAADTTAQWGAAPPAPAPPWSKTGKVGCVVTREWAAPGGCRIEELQRPGSATAAGSHCWRLTEGAPCLGCCYDLSCVAMRPDLKARPERVNRHVSTLRQGLDATVSSEGRLVLDSNAVTLVEAYGLATDRDKEAVRSARRAAQEAGLPQRRIILLPLKAWALRAVGENMGHWMSSVFLPLLSAAWGTPGAVWPIVLRSCSHRARQHNCYSRTVRRAYDHGQSMLWGRSEYLGLPWVRHAGAHPRPGDDAGYWRLVLGCESCPPQERLSTRMPLLRQWLSLRYPGFSFAPLQPAAGRRRRLLLLTRIPHGSRCISGQDALLAAAGGRGWSAQAVDVTRPCSHAAELGQLMNNADVVVGATGADLGFAAVMQRTGGIMVEVIDSVYAYEDGWQVFQAFFGSALKAWRVVLPHRQVEYHADGPGAHPAVRSLIQRVRKTTWECAPERNRSFPISCWRFLPSTFHISPGLWDALLDAASAALSGREVGLQQAPPSTEAPTPSQAPAPPLPPGGPRRRGVLSRYKR